MEIASIKTTRGTHATATSRRRVGAMRAPAQKAATACIIPKCTMHGRTAAHIDARTPHPNVGRQGVPHPYPSCVTPFFFLLGDTGLP